MTNNRLEFIAEHAGSGSIRVFEEDVASLKKTMGSELKVEKIEGRFMVSHPSGLSKVRVKGVDGLMIVTDVKACEADFLFMMTPLEMDKYMLIHIDKIISFSHH